MVLNGDRFITTLDIKASGLTIWAAPFTGGFDCTIPEGTILVAKHDQVKGVNDDAMPYKVVHGALDVAVGQRGYL